MSSDEVGVDPPRVSQAAGALENLRDVLAANVPIIVNTMQEYWSSGAGTPISLAALHQAQARSPEDASDMRTRADLAAAWLAQGVSLTGSGMVDIPWGSTPAALKELDQLDAQAQATALSNAEAESGSNPKAARATITSIELDITDHVKSGDTNWLTTFYTDGAPAVASLAATLNSEDGQKMVVLSPQDQKILNTYATGLAYADKHGTLSQTTINAFSKSNNLWSVGMLFKFGPPGSAYGTQETLGTDSNGNPVTQPNLVAQVTTAIELARMRGGYNIPLTGSDVPLGSPGSTYVQQLMAEFDPAPAMLTLATQNGAAAREVLAGPDGKQIASDLMTRPAEFYYASFDGSKLTGFMPIASPKPYFDGEQMTPDDDPLNWQDHQVTYSPAVIGKFLDTAANGAPRGDGPAAYNSAQAAMNLIEAVPSPTGDDGVHLPEPVRQALLHTAQNYMLDLAQSTTNTGTSIVEGPEAGMPVYHLLLQGQGKDNPLSTLLQQISYDKSDAATLDASAKVTFGNIYAATELGKLPPGFNGAQANNAMAGLLGRIQTEANNVGVHLATDSDEQHEEYNKIIDLGESMAPFLPGVGDAADAATDPVKGVLGLLGIPTEFSTNAAATTEQADAQSFAAQGIQIHVTMVQGLMGNGASDLVTNAQQYNSSQPKQLQWLQGNQIVLTQQNYSSFQNWYENLSPALDQKYGLSSLESRYGYYYNQQGGTSSDGAFGPW